jgi:rhamnogalacturonyl hydrolase YesR
MSAYNYPASLAIDAIMEQAQVFASTYSLVGGRFDDGSKMQQSDDEKIDLRQMIAAAIENTIDTEFLSAFAAWNLATFGPGRRTAGTVAHIRKELLEIEADPTDPKEWIDVLLLAVNGLIRIGRTPAEIIEGIRAKHATNQARDWPDWRNHPDTPIEHNRSEGETQ